MNKFTYSTAILDAYNFLLKNYPEVFVIGQGLWSPWYVGNTMKDLDKKFGKKRIIDTPVSEAAVTGAAVGASLNEMKPIVVHPRMDFMMYAMDPIINQAAKWSYMFGGQSSPSITIRGIINRGGEQGAQHSQALHSLFAHIPGLKVVLPSSVADARDLLIASVLADQPVIYIDDRWLYDQEDNLPEAKEINLESINPCILREGDSITLVGCSYSTFLLKKVTKKLIKNKINPEIIDMRIINPFNSELITNSVKKTGRLFVLDGGWGPCGISSEIISSAVENVEPKFFKSKPARLTLPFTPAPTSKFLEKEYYPTEKKILNKILKIFENNL